MNKILRELVQMNGCDAVATEILFKLEEYYVLTRRWSEKINITANVNEMDYLTENILDPILAHYALKNTLGIPMAGGVHDLGCGGGYVGLTWALLDPTIKCTLVDSDRKKINFCKQAIRDLGLQGRVDAYQSRIEDLEGISGVVVSRATWGGDGFFCHLQRFERAPCVGVYLGGKNDPVNHNPKFVRIPYTIQPENIVHYLFLPKEHVVTR